MLRTLTAVSGLLFCAAASAAYACDSNEMMHSKEGFIFKIVGNSDLTTGINVASLALKHRQNKNQRQRVVVFVGSPVEQTEEDLVKLGKKLKKNNIAVDIISFGEDVENEEKLSKFIEAVNSGDNR